MARADWSDEERRLRTDLAACYRLVAVLGLDDLIYSHISVRAPGSHSEFIINPYGLLFDEITASNLVRVDQEGRVVDGSDAEVNLAGFVIHSAVHAAREDAACVLHTHAESIVSLASTPEGFLPLSQFSMWFYRRTGTHPYEGVAIDADERERLVRDLGTHRVLLMPNHGILTAGRTVGEAFMLLYYAERAAQIQLRTLAALAGRAPVLPPPDVCERAAEQFWGQKGDILVPGTREWPALLRRLDRTDPSYRD
jgi:ribulose-5-phosphate 4-epimerase/fuculose-1-phosphate aldolase